VTALFVGTALAVASLCFVLYPLYRADISPIPRGSGARRQRSTQAVDALRELEFDRETGKISDADYGPLKARYTEQALVAMRAGDAPVCDRCGPRTETDAQYCSNCGSMLVG
jgi:ribosomal protein L40E